MEFPAEGCDSVRHLVHLFDEFVSRRLACAPVGVLELSLIRLRLAVDGYRPPRGVSPATRDYSVAALNYAMRVAEASYKQYLGEVADACSERASV